jgi:hypothetical protein
MEDLGSIWKTQDESCKGPWNKQHQKLMVEFKRKNGHRSVAPQTKKKDGAALGKWVRHQRRRRHVNNKCNQTKKILVVQFCGGRWWS